MAISFIDLFGGAGGWSVGLESIGWKHLALYDINDSALKTSRNNFDCEVVQQNLADPNVASFIKHRPDVIVGSPPCQGFSNEGKKDADDPRNNLVWKFFDIVDFIRPSVWVFENVPGFKQSYGGTFFKALSHRLSRSKYKWDNWILNAADFGVPQYRKRFVAIGALNFQPTPPEPTHSDSPNILGLEEHVSLWDAISDLPKPPLGERIGKYTYHLKPKNNYQIEMRKGSNSIFNHTTQNHSTRVLEKIKKVRPGESMDVFVGKYDENKVAYCGGYRRAVKDLPSWTAYWTRGMTSIHPEQDRFLSPRECARIQSFPDSHIFHGTTIENYTQICNAVPPKLSAAVGKVISQRFLSQRYLNSKTAMAAH